MKRVGLAVTIALLASTAAAHAVELPEAYLGSWTNDDMGAAEITGIHIGPRTYHEPGYNCDIRSVQQRAEAGTFGRGPVYLVEMRCASEGPPSRGKLVREVWALRKIDNNNILAIAGTDGPTFPSIHLLRRPGPEK